MPVPLVAIGLGVAGGIAFEYVTSAGKASKRDYAVAGAVGALPVGLGFRAASKGASKLSKLRHFSRKHGDEFSDIPFLLTLKESPINLRPEAYAIGSGVAANVVVGIAYDRIIHSSSGDSEAPRGSTRTSTTQRVRRVGSKSSHRPRRRPSSTRRRKRCPPGFKRVGNRCVPVRKGGRHRYT